MYSKDEIIEKITQIRQQINHEQVDVEIKDIQYKDDELTIITPDRPEKSIVIGKGGWVVGKLKEDLGVKSVHVVSYTDIMLKEYQMNLSLKHLKKMMQNGTIDDEYMEVFENIYELLTLKAQRAYDNTIVANYIKENINRKPVDGADVVVALSGGVDSSFSVLLAKAVGFNIHPMTVDPGTIVLPKQFHRNIDNLTSKIGVKHEYLKTDMSEIINDALSGKIHPCGRCSSHIEDVITKKVEELNISCMIYGDLLSTGSQSVVKKDSLMRINLPALFRMEKTEIKNVIIDYDVKKIKGYGCPLIVEVHKNHPQYRSFSIQRVLRETRAGILEPGEALDLIRTI